MAPNIRTSPLTERKIFVEIFNIVGKRYSMPLEDVIRFFESISLHRASIKKFKTTYVEIFVPTMIEKIKELDPLIRDALKKVNNQLMLKRWEWVSLELLDYFK